MCRQPVQDRPHAMLAYAEIEIATSVAPDAIDRALLIARVHSEGLKITQLRQRRHRRWVQIRRTADQCRQASGDGIHHLAPGNPRRHALWVCRENGNIPIPSIGQFAAHDLLKGFGQIRKRPGVR